MAEHSVYEQGFQVGVQTAHQLLQERKEFWLQQPDTAQAQEKIQEIEVLQLVLRQRSSNR